MRETRTLSWAGSKSTFENRLKSNENRTQIERKILRTKTPVELENIWLYGVIFIYFYLTIQLKSCIMKS